MIRAFPSPGRDEWAARHNHYNIGPELVQGRSGKQETGRETQLSRPVLWLEQACYLSTERRIKGR